MESKQHRKIWMILYGITAVVWLVNYILLPETVISGVRVVNGVQSLVYSAKWYAALVAMACPLVGPYLWNTRVKRLDQKIAENPNLFSYQIRRFWAVVSAWLFSAMGLIVGIGVFVLNL